MGTESLLSDYLTKTKVATEKIERSEVVARIESI
jgi:hypothetical protein